MAVFTQRVVSDDRIAAPKQDICKVLLDPDQLAVFTPLVDRITVDGDRWTWSLVGVSALGTSVAPTFTTIMDISEDGFAFRPDPGSSDRASARGELRVTPDGPDHTELHIDLTASIELPLPRMARGAVEQVMFRSMKAGGSRFADNLLAHLGNPTRRGMNLRRAD